MSCKTCKHWDAKGEYWDIPEGWGRCTAAPMMSEMQDWDVTMEKQIILPEYKNTMMCAMDGSSYKADVYTRPDFFCAMESDQ